MKKNIEWFRHYADSSEHAKFCMLRDKYGWAGEGRFWALNGMIAKASECRLDLNKKYNMAPIAVKLGLSVDELKDFLAYLETECELVRMEDGFLTTRRLCESYHQVSTEREKARERKNNAKNGSKGNNKGSGNKKSSSGELSAGSGGNLTDDNDNDNDNEKEKENEDRISPQTFDSGESLKTLERVKNFMTGKIGHKSLYQKIEAAGVDMDVPTLVDSIANYWVNTECREFNPKNPRNAKAIHTTIEWWLKNEKESEEKVKSSEMKEAKVDSVFEIYSRYSRRLIGDNYKRSSHGIIRSIFKSGETLESIDKNFSKIKRLGADWKDFMFIIKNYEKLKNIAG